MIKANYQPVSGVAKVGNGRAQAQPICFSAQSRSIYSNRTVKYSNNAVSRPCYAPPAYQSGYATATSDEVSVFSYKHSTHCTQFYGKLLHSTLY